MRIVNVIVIKEGIVDSIDSFGVFEEQLSEDVVEQAQELFREKCLEYSADEEKLDDYIEEGYYSGMNFSICITSSYI
jgi:hypothetical protein